MNWTTVCDITLRKWKDALCSEPVLKILNFESPFTLLTDVSDQGVGGVLSQLGADRNNNPVSYFSIS